MDAFALKLIKNGQTTVSNYLLSNFPRINMTPVELVVFIQLKRFSNEGIKMPPFNMLTHSTGFSREQIYEILHVMIHKKLMKINTTYDKEHHRSDEYDFSLMYKKLSRLSHSNHDDNEDWKLNNINRTNDNSVTVSSREKVFKTIEEEFGRCLSQMESDTVDSWMTDDNYSPEMILLALKQAVLSQVYNLKYINRILNNWDALNIRTPQALQTYNNKKRQRFGKRVKPNLPNGKKGPHIPIFKI